MTNHIKKLSQEKLKMEKRINELERNNKNLEDYIRTAKNIERESEANYDTVSERNAVYINSEGELDISIETLLSSKTHKKSNGPLRSSNQTE